MRYVDKTTLVSVRQDPKKLVLAKGMRQKMTEAEACLWRRLRGSQLGGLHFRRQQVIDGFIPDFYCHTARLAVEADSRSHELQADYDAERDRIIAARGILVLRFSNDRILNDTSVVLAEILAAAMQRVRPSWREGG